MTTMMMTKNPVILMACILLFSSLATSNNTFGPDKCCFKFFPNRLPKDRVVSFKFTDKLCAMEGVLFSMKKGHEICADPDMQWVKDLMEAKKRSGHKQSE